MFAVVITGPPGAGKTTVLSALTDALSDDGVPHAAVESEALRWAHPALTYEQEMRNVKAVCALYREYGRELMLIGQTIETDDDLAEILDALGADESFVVRLEANPATLAERIIQRESDGWPGLSELVEHAQQLAATVPAAESINLVLSTEGQPPDTVAAQIREALPTSFTERDTPRS
jgi:chloramphenicol 3-O-phosphotransferase